MDEWMDMNSDGYAGTGLHARARLRSAHFPRPPSEPRPCPPQAPTFSLPLSPPSPSHSHHSTPLPCPHPFNPLSFPHLAPFLAARRVDTEYLTAPSVRFPPIAFIPRHISPPETLPVPVPHLLCSLPTHRLDTGYLTAPPARFHLPPLIPLTLPSLPLVTPRPVSSPHPLRSLATHRLDTGYLTAPPARRRESARPAAALSAPRASVSASRALTAPMEPTRASTAK
eukprot:134858-Chlamydomonas_euryale.AAC.1